ncbi:MAG: 50S ribosomal protein L29 [Gemmataceae bacterium]
MKAAELAKLADDALATQLKETQRHLFQLRFQSATDRLETPSEIRMAKKEIARILTEQRKRDLVKLDAIGDDALKAAIAEAAENKNPGGAAGRRKPTRTMKRLAKIFETRLQTAAKNTPTAAKPVAGKGK